MYIDKYKVEIKGNKYHEKTDKKMTDQVLATYQSDDGMNIKKLMNVIEELAECHDAQHTINFDIYKNNIHPQFGFYLFKITLIFVKFT